MHFRGEGKTPVSRPAAAHLFYPMHFRGEGKTVRLAAPCSTRFYPMHFRGEGKTLPLLHAIKQAFYPMHFRGEGKTISLRLIEASMILPDALPGGRQNINAVANCALLDFTRCTSGGKAKHDLADVIKLAEFYPMHFRGEGKTAPAHWRWCIMILPDALPGGRQNKANFKAPRHRHFTRCTSGGKAKRRHEPSCACTQILPDALPGGRQNVRQFCTSVA